MTATIIVYNNGDWGIYELSKLKKYQELKRDNSIDFKMRISDKFKKVPGLRLMEIEYEVTYEYYKHIRKEGWLRKTLYFIKNDSEEFLESNRFYYTKFVDNNFRDLKNDSEEFLETDKICYRIGDE